MKSTETVADIRLAACRPDEKTRPIRRCSIFFSIEFTIFFLFLAGLISAKKFWNFYMVQLFAGGLGNANRIFGKFVKKTVTFCSNLLVSSLILQII
ncbi:MAG: hypothetical protein AAFN16_18510, partial [Pseudomonadota bacterium]